MSDSTTNTNSSSKSQPSAAAAAADSTETGAAVDWATQWANLIKQEEQLQPDGRFGFEQIGRLLTTMRAKLSQYAWRNVAKPRARAFTDPATGRSLVRFYYLVANNFLGQTLWYVDVEPDAAAQSGASSPSGSSQRRVLVNLLTIKTQLMSSPGGNRGLSREEELLQERKRSFSTGIVDYDLDPVSGTIVFAYQNFVCHLVDNLNASSVAEIVPNGIEVPHTPLNLALCPSDNRLAAYAAEQTVYCVCLDSKQILAAFNLPSESNALSAGLPSFAVQEEFDRFHGFWWRPANDRTPPASRDLVIEIVDESAVQSIKIVDPLKGGLETDSFSYPRAGTPNAVSSLVHVAVCRSNSNGGSLTCTQRPIDGLQLDEYLVRADWTNGGEALLVQAMNRGQDRLRLLAYFPNSDAEEEKLQSPICLLEEVCPSNRWIDVHDLLRPLSVSNCQAELIWASEETGFRHLYHVTCAWLPGELQARCNRRQLTFVDWQVQPDHLSVDKAAGWLYFNSTCLDPRCVQLCRVNYFANHDSSGRVETLTGAHNLAGSAALPKTCTGLTFPEQGVALLTVHCSQHSPEARLCSLQNGLPTMSLLTGAIGCDNFFLQPEYFQFTGPGGQLLNGLLFRPFNYSPGRQYPTLQYVYGGPHVQLVTSAFVGFSFHRVTKACYFGFCVLIVDNRGSENRGREFAAQIHHRLGSLELPDQVAGLQFAAEKFGCIDLNRVGLFGWSYGGYLTLRGMRDYNNIYRLGVAGAPVTEWELYDTAYTERYMGLPDGQGGRYEASSVIGGSSVSGFPSEANRLLIVHGSIDENVHYYHTAKLLDKLVLAKKPYSLLIYPSERHGLRNAPSKDHFETCLMHYLCQNI